MKSDELIVINEEPTDELMEEDSDDFVQALELLTSCRKHFKMILKGRADLGKWEKAKLQQLNDEIRQFLDFFEVD